MSDLVKQMFNTQDKVDHDYQSAMLPTDADKLAEALGVPPISFTPDGRLSDKQDLRLDRMHISDKPSSSINGGMSGYDLRSFQQHDGLAYFFALIAVCMQDPDTKSMFESEAKRLDMHSVLDRFFNNAEVEIVEDERIVNKALEYTLSTRSPQAARYVLHQ